MIVFVYVDTSKQVGDAAETWFAEHDPEGVAFEYDVLEMKEASN